MRSPVQRRAGALLLIALLLATTPAVAIEAGEPLAAALAQLAKSGLRIVYSSALVPPDLRVTAAPPPGSPEDTARVLLAPHGLALEAVQPGLFVVVRRSPAASDTGAIELDVLWPDGAAARGVRVALDPGGRIAVSDDSGQVRFDGLGPGRYDVDARETQGASAALRRIRVAAGEVWRGVLQLDAGGAPLAEVSVLASRYVLDRQSHLSMAEFTSEDLSALPGLDQDAMRVTRYLPGTATNGLSARAHVRGGRDDELAVYFDGAPLYEPFHFKDFQNILGVLDPAVIGRVDFWSGVMPARFGGRISGVLDYSPREYTGTLYNEIGVSPLYASALSQGSLSSQPLEWLVAARISFVGELLELFDRRTADPQFLDVLGRLTWRFDDGSDVALGWLLLDDELSADYDDGTEIATARYRDSNTWLRGTWQLGDRGLLQGVLAHSERDTNRDGTLARTGNAFGELNDRRDVSVTTASIDYTITRGRASLGFGATYFDMDAGYDYTSAAVFNPLLAQVLGRPAGIDYDTQLDASGRAWGGYASMLYELTDRVRVDVGLRWDEQRYEPSFNAHQFTPRVGVEYAPRPDTVLRVSWGRASQTERPDELEVSDGDPTFHAPQIATQAVAAIEHRLTPSMQLRFEAFDKRTSDVRPIYENILDPVTLLPEIEVDRLNVAPLSTRAYGGELTFRFEPRETWAAWLTYGWSQVTDDFGDSQALRTWDQKHSAVTGASWTRAPWQLSANLFWHSGWRQNSILVEGSGPGATLELTPRNAEAWSDYVSLDLRASWERALPIGALRLYAEVSNATDNQNWCCTDYRIAVPGEAASLTSERSTWLPRFALIGAVWMFP